MDFGDFDRSFDKLKIILRDMISKDKSFEKSEIYSSYIDYRAEIKVIIERIETETQKHMMLTQKVFKAIKEGKKGKEIPDEWGIESLKNLVEIRLDVKSFFVFTRIFLDTLARIIRISYGKIGHQLPSSMSDLVKHKKFENLDSDFSKGLKDKISWMDDFRETRVEIEHHLGDMRSTHTKNGKFGFDIRGLRRRGSWGTHTVKSITDYMSDTLGNLSEVISHICNKFLSRT